MDSIPLNDVYACQLGSIGSISSNPNANQHSNSSGPLTHLHSDQPPLNLSIHDAIQIGLALEAEDSSPFGFSFEEKGSEPEQIESSSPLIKGTRQRRVTSKADLAGHTWSFDVNKKENPLLFINSYHFRMDKGVYGPGVGAERLLPTNSYNWICVTGKCKVRANTRGQKLYHLTSHEHLHDTQVNQSAVRRIEAIVHNAAKRSREDADELIARLQAENAVIFAGVDITSSHIRNVVKKARPTSQPKLEIRNLASLEAPKSHSFTLRGALFLQYFSPAEEGNNRFQVFSTQRNFERLATATQWHIDGSFGVCPKPFESVLIVSAEVRSKLMPLVYFLLPNKLQSTYTECFTYLLSKVGCCRPSSITMDFEPTQHAALKALLPNTFFRGCFFYFCQALYRRIYGVADLRQFNNLPATSSKLRMLLALAYVPPQAVQSYFSTILNDPFYTEHQATLAPLLEYMACIWIGFFNSKGAWVQPRVQLPWNCFNDAIQKRASNKGYIEYLHTSLNKASHIRGFDASGFGNYILSQQELVDSDLDLAQNNTALLPREPSAAAAKRDFDLYSLCSLADETTDKAIFLENLSRILVFGGHQITTTYEPASDMALSVKIKVA
ncbi:hypothetical protein DSO57_1039635 [Entomophthora muscae]|uniref:Uncharacterized protein n=1 Tax=Entomophthora muscae TaxID=34485 RepID=A0ACC2SEP1_9FUNG|nr:hypothetical protein DSO57_1039635 [Entomophthora muscae]